MLGAVGANVNIVVRFWQPTKASPDIDVTLAGIMMVVILS